ncbi:glycosyltransferase family 2 protein [Alteromonas facilis]|uniref:glycosyltransferase family 2 protein n=1 Tax=Alteromonas facilis TaxID=2048004 RepID=UPI000C28DE80|nr:glycosyltransferase family 2 protein [Alteromonas facilis]
MKINAICVVKNEADIIEETLLNAMKYCHRIYIFDNGSDDGTWEIMCSMASRFKEIEIAFRSDEPFTNQLRNRIYNQYNHLYSKEDWWYILDGDEMLSESPAPLLMRASKAAKTCVKSWFAQFYYTDKDLSDSAIEDDSQPIALRRKHYRINWKEWRFFKNDPTQKWPENTSARVPPFSNKVFKESTIIRHYAHRTIEQLERRNKIRLGNPENFVHVTSKEHLKTWIKSSKDLFVYNNDNEYQLPLKDVVSYYLKEVKFWITWRFQNIKTVMSRGYAMLHCGKKALL